LDTKLNVAKHLLLPPKKLTHRRWKLNNLATGGQLTYITDAITGRRFLIDTGASKSILPHSSSSTPSGPSLFTADGQPVPTWGFQRLPVRFGNRQFHFPFLLAAVSSPIIGHDFLTAHHLIVDPTNHSLLDRRSFQIIAIDSAFHQPIAKTTAAPLTLIPPPVQKLLAKFPTILGTDLQAHKPTHGITHNIETTG
jgi:hypothetical protein